LGVGVNAQDTRCFNPEFPLPPADTRDCTTGAYFIDPKDPNLITVDAKTYGNPAYISKVAPGGLDGKTIQLDVDLIIDVSYLIKKCRFRIKEGVIISMAKDKSLRVDQSHFWACEKMWKGIYVTEGDSFQQLGKVFLYYKTIYLIGTTSAYICLQLCSRICLLEHQEQ
jgi:hypothetical protein